MFKKQQNKQSLPIFFSLINKTTSFFKSNIDKHTDAAINKFPADTSLNEISIETTGKRVEEDTTRRIEAAQYMNENKILL